MEIAHELDKHNFQIVALMETKKKEHEIETTGNYVCCIVVCQKITMPKEGYPSYQIKN